MSDSPELVTWDVSQHGVQMHAATKWGSVPPRDPVIAEWLSYGAESNAGVVVTEKTAMTVSAYFAAIRNISEDIAKLPLKVFEISKRNGRTRREEQLDHPIYHLIHDSPNEEMTAMVFWETILHHAMGWGRGLAQIIRDNSGQAESLWLLDPTQVRPERGTDGVLRYVDSGGTEILEREQVLHIHGLGFDGVDGYSIATMARESMGEALAQQQFGGAFYGNNAVPAAVIETQEHYDAQRQKEYREGWNQLHKGPSRSQGIGILWKGATLRTFSVSPEDAQFIEGRHFSIEEAARWFRMPPHKLQHLLRSTFNNIESQSREYIGDTLSPWMRRIVQEVNRKLLAPPLVSADYDLDLLQLGDIAAQTNGLAQGKNWGWMNTNDCREKLGLNPIDEPWADEYWMPANMTPASQEPEEEPGVPTQPAQPVQQEQPAQPIEDGDREAMAENLLLAIRGRLDALGAKEHRLIRKWVKDCSDSKGNLTGSEDKLDLEIKIDGFYPDFEKEIEAEMGPILAAYVQSTPAAESAIGKQGKALPNMLVIDSCTRLRSAMKSGSPVQVMRVCEYLKSERPEAIIRRIKNEPT